jgi:hypothetical protein
MNGWKSEQTLIILNMAESYTKMAELKEKMGGVPNVEIELETRMIIPTIDAWEPDVVLDIPYFRSRANPNVNFRRTAGGVIESKEMVERMFDGDIVIVLSVEKTHRMFRGPLVEYMQRHIERKVVGYDEGKTVITKENDIFTLEIEFDLKSVEFAKRTVEKYKIPFWPAKKPNDGYAAEILGAITSSALCVSEKIDGVHVIIYISDENVVVVDDGGRKQLWHGNMFVLSEASEIYEGEVLDENIHVFDVMRAGGVDIINKRYNYRRREYKAFYKSRMKPIHPFASYNELRRSYEKIVDAPKAASDGVILTNMGRYKSTVYKSKPIPTVDLMYYRGYLYMGGESESTREPAPGGEQVSFEDGVVYEFTLDMRCLRPRPDKLVPNARMPVAEDPVRAICTGSGIPCLRYHHNKIKSFLLEKLEKTSLIDIGSRKGGDVDKWIAHQFKRVYAVDPDLELRKQPSFVVPLRCRVQEMPAHAFDSVACFFVPWSDSFLDFFIKARTVAFIAMDRAYNAECSIYTVSVHDTNGIKTADISIPETSTAMAISESLPDIDHIGAVMRSHGFEHKELTLPLTFASEDEIRLADMYSYHLFIRNYL